MLPKSDKGSVEFQMTHIEKDWTKKEIFKYFNVEHDDDIKDTGQVISGCFIIKKNTNSSKLINLWKQTLNNNSLLFTNYYNKNQESYFKDNRHDQSIFSVILKIHGSILLEYETYVISFGGKKALKYPFWATRIRY